MIAIASHKFLVSLALGNIAFGNLSKAVWTGLFVFSFATPCGVFIGYAISSSADSNAVSLLQAFCSGTLLYVATVEILGENKSNEAAGVGPKLVSGSLGFRLMTMLAAWV